VIDARHLSGTQGTLIDVGSGAGFPGAVCALMCPDLAVTLVERTQKKAAFLLTLRRELGLTLRVLAQDISQVTERFHVVVSRAAFPPPIWQKVGAQLVAEGGLLLAMVGGKEGALSAPPTFTDEIDHLYDVGAGPRRIRGWRKFSRNGPSAP
jgi:16S rRNA (guanine527-N7)-methyltransferase